MEKRKAHNCADDSIKTVQVRSRVHKYVYDNLKDYADKEGITVSLLIRNILMEKFLDYIPTKSR